MAMLKTADSRLARWSDEVLQRGNNGELALSRSLAGVRGSGKEMLFVSVSFAVLFVVSLLLIRAGIFDNVFGILFIYGLWAVLGYVYAALGTTLSRKALRAVCIGGTLLGVIFTIFDVWGLVLAVQYVPELIGILVFKLFVYAALTLLFWRVTVHVTQVTERIDD